MISRYYGHPATENGVVLMWHGPWMPSDMSGETETDPICEPCHECGGLAFYVLGGVPTCFDHIPADDWNETS